MTNQHEDTITIEKENNHIFNSVDFQKFLNNQNNNSGGSFFTASKDDSSSFPAFETFDSRSGLGIYSQYSSLDGSSDFWQSMRDLQQQQQSSSPPDTTDEKTTKDSSPSSDLTATITTTTAAAAKPNGISKEDRFRSNEWVTMKNLGNHVDVSYNQGMFRCESCDDNNKRNKGLSSSSSSSSEPLTNNNNNNGGGGAGTNWEDLFYAQIQQHNAGGAEDAFRIPSRDEQQQQDTTATTPAAVAKKKRKRSRNKPRSKLEPKNKVYVVPTDIDILMGRGGKSNNHPGNKRYREEVHNFRQSYTTLSDKDDKTGMSQLVVETIKSTGARFLELDRTANSWYVVSDIKARRKVSQALREDDDPAKRAAKRQRFLKKRRAAMMMK